MWSEEGRKDYMKLIEWKLIEVDKGNTPRKYKTGLEKRVTEELENIYFES